MKECLLMRRKFGDSHKNSETRERQLRDIEQDICEGVVRKKSAARALFVAHSALLPRALLK